MISGFVYILKSLKNGRYYIGSTINLDRRVDEHNSGKSKYTSESGPFELVFSQEFENVTLARKVEYWLKSQKDRDFVGKIVKDGRINRSNW